MDGEQLEAVFAQAEFIILISVSAAAGADESTPSLRVPSIDPVTAHEAFENLYVVMAVINHRDYPALLTKHKSCLILLVEGCLFWKFPKGRPVALACRDISLFNTLDTTQEIDHPVKV